MFRGYRIFSDFGSIRVIPTMRLHFLRENLNLATESDDIIIHVLNNFEGNRTILKFLDYQLSYEHFGLFVLRRIAVKPVFGFPIAFLTRNDCVFFFK